MSDRNLVNAGSAESRNLDSEFVTVMAGLYCTTGICCWNGDGLLRNRVIRSCTVSTGPGGVWLGGFGCVRGGEAITEAYVRGCGGDAGGINGGGG